MCSARGSPKIVVIAAAILVFIAGEQAGADVVYSTFGPGDSYNTHVTRAIGGQFSPPDNYSQGNQFSFTGSRAYYVDTIELVALWYRGTNQVDVSLMSDDAGRPGSVIESLSFIDQLNEAWNTATHLIGTSSLRPLLTPGTDYWLIASAPDTTLVGWFPSDPPVLGMQTQRASNGDPWQTWYAEQGVFRISGEPAVVPVPGAAMLGVIGLMSVAGWRRRRGMA